MEDRYDKKQVGKRLRELRIILGLTQREFSNNLHWGESNYRKIENGDILLSTDKAQQLNEKFSIDLNYLLTGKGYDPLSSELNVMDVFSASMTDEEKIKRLSRLAKYAIIEIEERIKRV